MQECVFNLSDRDMYDFNNYKIKRLIYHTSSCYLLLPGYVIIF
jgi:hypothetical protein